MPMGLHWSLLHGEMMSLHLCRHLMIPGGLHLSTFVFLSAGVGGGVSMCEDMCLPAHAVVCRCVRAVRECHSHVARDASRTSTFPSGRTVMHLMSVVVRVCLMCLCVSPPTVTSNVCVLTLCVSCVWCANADGCPSVARASIIDKS